MRSHYDPRTREIVLSPCASLYCRFHELAHREQHETRAAPFLAWSKCCPIRVLGYFALLWIEWDAYRRARRVMQRLGVWSKEACIEARNTFISYVTQQEIT